MIAAGREGSAAVSWARALRRELSLNSSNDEYTVLQTIMRRAIIPHSGATGATYGNAPGSRSKMPACRRIGVGSPWIQLGWRASLSMPVAIATCIFRVSGPAIAGSQKNVSIRFERTYISYIETARRNSRELATPVPIPAHNCVMWQGRDVC